MRSVETVTSIGRRLRYAQIGGGRDSFIGAIHRRAAALDGFVELTAGALSSTGDKALASARDLLLPPERSYASWQELVEGERARPAEERIDFVSIVTPNHVHFEPALACVEAGFHVVIDKPMVHDSTQAERLARAVAEHGTVFAVTYNYTGYPMVKEARHWIEQGRIGAIRRVVVEYAQGWLSPRSTPRVTSRPSGGPIPPARESPAPWATSARTARAWSATSPGLRSGS